MGCMADMEVAEAHVVLVEVDMVLAEALPEGTVCSWPSSEDDGE